MKVSLICITSILLFSAPFAPTKHIQAKAQEDILQRKVPGNEIEFLTTTDAFYSSLGRTRSPGGMARLASCEPDTLLQSWKPSEAALREVLDVLVASDPRYKWKMEDDVVNLLPATGEPTLLKTRLSEFNIEDTASARAALAQLLALSEVKKRMRDLHLKPGIALITGLSTPHPTKFSVKQSGGTLRDALNAIARAEGQGIWDYVETHCNGTDEVMIRF